MRVVVIDVLPVHYDRTRGMYSPIYKWLSGNHLIKKFYFANRNIGKPKNKLHLPLHFNSFVKSCCACVYNIVMNTIR